MQLTPARGGSGGAWAPIGTPAAPAAGADGVVQVQDAHGSAITLAPAGITIAAAARVGVAAPQVEVTAGSVRVAAGMSKFDGVVQCDRPRRELGRRAALHAGAGNIA